MGGSGRTVVVLVAELFPGSGSLGFPVTLAALLKAPTEVGITTIVTVALAPFPRLPKAQVTVVDVPLQVGVADTKVTPPSRGSVTVTPVALFGPLFLTVRV
jgi:hypothetical protein